MRVRPVRLYGGMLLAAAVLFSACAGSSQTNASSPAAITAASPKSGPVVKVGSADFTESRVVAEIYALSLERNGFKVQRVAGPGVPRPASFPLVEKGDISVMPEYLGSLLSFLTKNPNAGSADEAVSLSKLNGELAKRGVTALKPAPGQDKDSIVVNKQTAGQYNLKKISDLAAAGDKLVFGARPECAAKAECLKGLRDVYGLKFKQEKTDFSDQSALITSLKTNAIQVTNLFSTEGAIKANDFVVLEDDKQMVKVSENILPIVNDAVLQAYGEDLSAVLNAVSTKLTTAELTDLNKAVDVDRKDVKAAASAWVSEYSK